MKRSDASEPALLTLLLLSAPSALFAAIAKTRSVLYDRGILPTHAVGLPVVSIGNLTAGGTGKTPITSYLTGELSKRGISCGIISRGYGGSEKGPVLISDAAAENSAQRFGDEPTWLAAAHGQVPVVVGADRVADVDLIKKTKSVDVVLADDAFQHRRLNRDLDIVIIDATEPQWHYHSLPKGRLRESFGALARADFVFISKTNQVSTEQLAWIRSRIESERKAHGFKLIEFEASLAGFTPLASYEPKAPIETNPFGERRVGRDDRLKLVLMSGIARPAVFEHMVENQSGASVVESFRFRDHQVYSRPDLAKVETRANQLRARAIVITEKDATKLRGWTPAVPCYVSRLIAQPSQSSAPALQELYETIGRLVR